MLRYMPPVLLLLLAACASTPSPSDQALRSDVCAVLALGGSPGMDQTKDLDLKDRIWVIQLEVKDAWSGLPVKDGRRGAKGPWGKCPGAPVRGVTSVGFSEGRKYAAKSGGWQAGPLMGGWGSCFYERRDSGWALVGCIVTAVS